MKSRKNTPDIMGDLMAVKTSIVDIEHHDQSKKAQENEAQINELHAVNSTQKGLSPAWTRATFIINKELNEKIKAIAYWDRLTVKEVLHEALMQYLGERNVKPMPKKKELEF